MRWLVTGGSGFLGGTLIRELVARGDAVVALARSDAAATKVEALGATSARGDLGDAAAIRAAAEGVDVIAHCAAFVEDWGPWEPAFDANVEGTQRVLDAAAAVGAKVVHVSTEAVLVGGPPIVSADETWPRPARPLGLYPTTKGLAEERVLAAAARGQHAMIVRPRFIWGAGDTTLLPRIVDAVRTGQWRWIAGGRYLTSTCHVRNVCEGIVCAAERGTAGGVWFLTDGDPVEFRAFISDMLATQGVTPPDASLPRWAARAAAALLEVAYRVLPGRPPLTRTAVRLIGEEVTVSDARARAELGYTSAVTVAEGLDALRV